MDAVVDSQESTTLYGIVLQQKYITELSELINDEVKMANHLVIIGMGLHGHNVAKAAKAAGIEYVILDNDPDIVRAEKDRGEHIYFGSASHEEVLKQCGVERAEVVVITPSNSTTVYQATDLVRKMNPKTHIIARIVLLEDMEDVYKYGANEVIPEEFDKIKILDPIDSNPFGFW